MKLDKDKYGWKCLGRGHLTRNYVGVEDNKREADIGVPEQQSDLCASRWSLVCHIQFLGRCQFSTTTKE